MIGLNNKSFVLRKVAYYEFSMLDVKETSKKYIDFHDWHWIALLFY